MNTNEIANDDFSSQLRSLRLLLGKNYRPISTTTLAELTNIPATAIQATEAGRRALNDKDRERIALFIGARWDEKTHQWVSQTDPQTPYSRAIYETHSKALVDSGALTAKSTAPLHGSIQYMVASLEGRAATDAMLELQFEIERIAKEHGADPSMIELIESQRLSLLTPSGVDEPALKTNPKTEEGRSPWLDRSN